MLVTIQIVGDAFLYRQVRNMVGCLVQVGQGKLQATQVQDLLESKNRSEAPTMAPAHGLFLVDVRHGEFKI
jgi:tRNA pseudouridine38-40 synthase